MFPSPLSHLATIGRSPVEPSRYQFGGERLILMHRHNRLHDYGAIIDALGHEKDGTSGETRAVIQRLLLGVEARKRGA